MSLIREKATESEAVVKNITKDIQVLDLAKKNLITSMTMMKRLQMLGVNSATFASIHLCLIVYKLVNALTQMEDLIREKKYSEVAQTLSVSLVYLWSPPRVIMSSQATKEISASLKSYTAVPPIARVWKRMQEIQSQLRTQLDADFDALYVLQMLFPKETKHILLLKASYRKVTNQPRRPSSQTLVRL